MDWSLPWDQVGRVLVAAVLGAAVGFDREVREHSAGLRTHALVATGAALFGVLSIDGFDEIAQRRALTNIQADVTRVASQVVVGVGFLGAGVIFRRGDSVRNLTTAASLWATAAIGLAAGLGDVALAVLGAVVLIVVLALVPIPESRLSRWVGRDARRVHLSLNEGVSVDDVRARVDGIPDVTIGRWRVEKHDGQIVVDAVLRAPSGIPFDDRLSGLAHDPALSDVRFGD
jgi:putative Mg2+ transporter-C (MgtC) family protein